MEHQKILNLLNEANNSKSDQSNRKYGERDEIIYNTYFLRSNLFDYKDAYILARNDITVTAAPATQVGFRNCASVSKCITKIDETTIDDFEDLYLVIPMYNVIKCSSNHSEKAGSLWFYSKDEATKFNNKIENIDILNLSSIRQNY